ncbi:MAG: YggS family pyridoxal phosphate-dependent enzyme [Acholeplasmataceae bacterium]
MSDIKRTTICASKYFSVEQIRRIYELGTHHFGENRVQDLIRKKNELRDLAITWHFIGHLQTNKVKDVLEHISYLHTLDRIKLARTIEKYAKRPLKCFIQVNMTREPQKSGIEPEKLEEFLSEMKNYDRIEVIGLMTIGKAQDAKATERAFKGLSEWASRLELPYLSMGMTEDYELALKYGATHLRIGRKFLEMLE